MEILVHWTYKHDNTLRLPYQDNLSALIHEPTFKMAAGDAIFNKARIITRLGNTAVHNSRPVNQYDAQTAVKELFHVGYWLAHTYAKGPKPAPGLVFDPKALPTTSPLPKQTVDQLQALATRLRERDEKLSTLQADKEALDAELVRLRGEIAEAKQANAVQADTHDYSESETRDYFIDLLLKEAGWPLDQKRDREFEVSGMPNNKGKGFVDYVLWGDDGLPLGLVEATRTKRDARVGQRQAELYADCLEKQFNQRPVIFYSNGYEHWIWDSVNYPPRSVQGFYKKAELELVVQRRKSRKPLGTAESNGSIVERYYQTRAIRRASEAFEKDKLRKALLVMATGAGKNADGDRDHRSAHAMQLGEASAIPGRSHCTRGSGGESIQKLLARCFARQSREREGRRRASVCVHISDDDGSDRRNARRPATFRSRTLRYRGDRRSPSRGSEREVPSASEIGLGSIEVSTRRDQV